MSNQSSLAMIACLLGFAPLCGCGELSPRGDEQSAEEFESPSRNESQQSSTGEQTADADPPAAPPKKKTTTIKRSFINSDSAAAQNSQFGGLSATAAAERVCGGIQESLDLGPTLVVWLFDQTNSSFAMVMEVQNTVSQFYESLADDEASAEDDAPLLTAVMAFGEQVEFLLDEPSGDPRTVIEALNAFRRDSNGKEATFAALQQARDKYFDFRTKQRREVMFVVVTDEAGDDDQLLEPMLDDFRKSAVPVYVIGVPAPFGRQAALTNTVEASIRQGPESREVERIHLAYWGDSRGLQLMDSGFGPFDLEWLCRASGGNYLALRPSDSKPAAYFSALDNRWPSPHAYRFDPAVMHRYTPQYLSAAEYQQFLASNPACLALHEASKLDRSEVLDYPPAEFVVQNEAALQRSVSEAQKIAARMGPAVDRFHEMLKIGEAGRASLDQPRWQAAFDLAMGRVLAAKARIEGYNSMLAALKRGMNFADPDHDRWYLESAAVTEDAGSGIKKLGTQAREYLTRVVEEHPGTPWAKIAERELQNDMGWKWSERGPSG